MWKMAITYNRFGPRSGRAAMQLATGAAMSDHTYVVDKPLSARRSLTSIVSGSLESATIDVRYSLVLYVHVFST